MTGREARRVEEGRDPSVPQTTDAPNERQASPCTLQNLLGLSGLESPQRAVETTSLEKLLVRPAFGDFAVVEYEDHVGVGYRAQPVCYGNRGPTSDEHAQRGVNLRFNLAVDGARRLVQQEQRRVR